MSLMRVNRPGVQLGGHDIAAQGHQQLRVPRRQMKQGCATNVRSSSTCVDDRGRPVFVEERGSGEAAVCIVPVWCGFQGSGQERPVHQV